VNKMDEGLANILAALKLVGVAIDGTILRAAPIGAPWPQTGLRSPPSPPPDVVYGGAAQPRRQARKERPCSRSCAARALDTPLTRLRLDAKTDQRLLACWLGSLPSEGAFGLLPPQVPNIRLIGD
jgi:hypothetical protein